jgi:cytoskeletal protein CcmA (bactofilin family)
MLDVALAPTPFTLVVLVLGFGPAMLGGAAQPREAEDQIVVSGTVEVARGREVDEVVVLHGSARIDGVALGDVIVLDGGITVRGQVSGSVIAMEGSVRLGSGAHVGGDVTARGGVVVSEAAVVDGRIRQHAAFTWRAPLSLFGRFATWLAVTVSTLLLGLVIVFLSPRGVEAISDAARNATWFAVAWGAGLVVGIPVVVVVALASLVVLPLGLAVALALALAAFAGYGFAGYALGRLVWTNPERQVMAFLAGWGALRVIGLIPLVSGVTFVLAAAFGLGAAAVATWRARSEQGRHRGRHRAALPPEPIPEEAGL